MSSPQEQSARDMLRQLLREWGIGELYKDAESLLTQGLDSNSIMLRLQNTDAYKTRFSANEDRRKSGLVALSPAEYVALETQYKTVMRTFGLPKGFYDSNDDLSKFIAGDVSAVELTERARVAQEVWLSTDDETKNTWRRIYGSNANGAAIAGILDPDVALPVLERMQASAQIGGAARRNGFTVARDRLEQFADLGVTADAAAEGYSEIAGRKETESGIAARFGSRLTQRDQEDDRILGLASARRKRELLQGKETALFDARVGASAGSLNKNASGKY